MPAGDVNVKEWLCGPMVAVATPFKEDFTLDLDSLLSNIRFMVDRGVVTGNGTLLVGGAGGEHPAMNVDERKAVMQLPLKRPMGKLRFLLVFSTPMFVLYWNLLNMLLK